MYKLNGTTTWNSNRATRLHAPLNLIGVRFEETFDNGIVRSCTAIIETARTPSRTWDGKYMEQEVKLFAPKGLVKALGEGDLETAIVLEEKWAEVKAQVLAKEQADETPVDIISSAEQVEEIVSWAKEVWPEARLSVEISPWAYGDSTPDVWWLRVAPHNLQLKIDPRVVKEVMTGDYYRFEAGGEWWDVAKAEYLDKSIQKMFG